MDVFKSIGQNLFKNIYLIIIFYILLGSFFEKSNIRKMLNALFKTLIGLMIMEIGLNVISSSVSNLNYMIPRAFKFISIIPQNEGAAALGEFRYGQTINSIMFLGMLINLLMAKLTKYKYIFLTGQQMIYMSSIMAIIMVPMGVDTQVASLIGGVLLGIMMSVFPSFIQPYTKKITKNNSMAVGHFSTIGFLMSAKIGQAVSELFKRLNYDELIDRLIKKPLMSRLKIKRVNTMFLDSTLITAMFMSIIFIISAIAAGSTYVEDISGGSNFIIFSFKQAILFACGVYIVLTGVRMLIQEIIPAFRGVAKKLVPDAVLALDVSILFPFKEGIMILGFIFSLLGGILAMLFTSSRNVDVMLPSILIHFFTGGGCGIYGYSTGGKKGCVVASFAMGFLISLTPLLIIDHYKSIGFSRIVFGEIDLSLVGFILNRLISILGLG